MSTTLSTLSLTHPDWPAAIYRVLYEPDDFSALLEDGITEVTYVAGGIGEREASDPESGRVSRTAEVADGNRELLRAIREVKGAEDMIAVIAREYDLDTGAYVSGSLRAYSLVEYAFDGIAASLTCARKNPSNIDAPTKVFTWSSSPGLR